MAYVLEQNFEAGGAAYGFVDATRYKAQTFADAGGFSLTKVEVFLRLANVANNTGNLVCEIYTADGSHLPDALVSAADSSIPLSSITADAGGEWLTYTFTGGVAVSAATEYAIVLSNDDGVDGDICYWWADTSSPTYTDGQAAYSNNKGVAWTAQATADYYFRAYSGSDAAYVDLAGSVAATALPSGALTVSGFPSGSVAATNSNLSVVAFGNNRLYYEDV